MLRRVRLQHRWTGTQRGVCCGSRQTCSFQSVDESANIKHKTQSGSHPLDARPQLGTHDRRLRIRYSTSYRDEDEVLAAFSRLGWMSQPPFRGALSKLYDIITEHRGPCPPEDASALLNRLCDTLKCSKASLPAHCVRVGGSGTSSGTHCLLVFTRPMKHQNLLSATLLLCERQFWPHLGLLAASAKIWHCAWRPSTTGPLTHGQWMRDTEHRICII